VDNKKRERAGCQAKKLGGKFFYLILCAQFPASLKKAISQHSPIVSSDKTTEKLSSTKLGSSEL